MATTSNRESRRRKILDAGSDRLALITRGLTSPPSEFNQEPKNNTTQPFISGESQLSDLPTVSRDEDDKGDNNAIGAEFLKQESFVLNSSHRIGSSVESHAAERKTHVEPSRAPASVLSEKLESNPIFPSDRDSSASTSTREQHVEPQTYESNVFTPNQISSAVSATQYARLFCSAVVAVMVVLSNLGFPLLGSCIIKGFLSFRPLYLLLLTNITIVLKQLLLDYQRQRRFQRVVGGDVKISSSDGSDWAEQASKALEVGLMMHKVIDAIFMDCSIYAVIVVCGISFC